MSVGKTICFRNLKLVAIEIKINLKLGSPDNRVDNKNLSGKKGGKMENTCSPSFEKFAERIDGETIMSLFENLSTRADAFTAV